MTEPTRFAQISHGLWTHMRLHGKWRHLLVQRLENWKLLRAFLWPNFLRSTMRASRVR